MSDIGRRHQLHGVQPVLPVADVDAAAAWFRDNLGFSIDFLTGTPAVHGRVKVGDRSWGDPIYIHLARTEAPIQPCGETRLHVGHDIDGLHAQVAAAGGTVLFPPVDQPWGLREFAVQAPAGHRLVLCRYLGAPDPAWQPRAVLACYRPRPGQEAALLELVRSHVPRLRALGLATDRAPLALRAADGTLVEAFEWSSPAAIERAHHDPEVLRMWHEFGAACDHVRLADLAEAQNLFAEFTPVDA